MRAQEVGVPRLMSVTFIVARAVESWAGGIEIGVDLRSEVASDEERWRMDRGG